MASVKMLQDFLINLCQKLFGQTQCEPGEKEMPGDKQTGATGNCSELQVDPQGKTSHSSDSEETNSSNAAPKKTTVLIMVAGPAALQQVG